MLHKNLNERSRWLGFKSLKREFQPRPYARKKEMGNIATMMKFLMRRPDILRRNNGKTREEIYGKILENQNLLKK